MGPQGLLPRRLRPCKGIQRSSVPSRRWKTNAYTGWCPIIPFRVVVDLRNVYFCHKIWIRLKKNLPQIWFGYYMLGYQKNAKIEKLKYSMRVEWFCSCVFLFVPENSRPIRPNLHTPWDLRVYWHSSFSLGKAPKVRAAMWQTIWNSTMARNVEIDFLYPNSGRWKPPIFCAQKDHGQFANNHCVADAFWMKKLIWV